MRVIVGGRARTCTSRDLMRHPCACEPAAAATGERPRAGAPARGRALDRLRPQDTRLDNYVDRYAERTHGMTASAIRALFAVANRPEVVSLAGGMPNIADLPLDVVGAALNDLVLSNGRQAMQYGSGQGEPAIREAICEVMKLEGIYAHPDDVTVTVGSQQGLDLVTRIFCDPGDVVLVEAPSYVGALGVFRAYQCDVVHVAMDEHGLLPDALTEAIAALQRGRAYGQVPLHDPQLPQPGRRQPDPGAPDGDPAGRRAGRPAGGRGQPVRAARLRRRAGAGDALARRRPGGLPGLLLQDLRARFPGRLGAGAARGPGEAGAGPGVGNPVPAGVLPVRGGRVPAPSRLARPDQDLPRDVPRAPRRHDRRADRPHAAGHHLDRTRTAGSSSGSRCRPGWTRRRCCRGPSRPGSRTCPARRSTPTGSAAGTCGCPTASPPRTGSSRAPGGSARCSPTRPGCWRPSGRPC